MFAYDTYYATNLGGSLWTLALEMQLYLIFPLLGARVSAAAGGDVCRHDGDCAGGAGDISPRRTRT